LRLFEQIQGPCPLRGAEVDGLRCFLAR
jgi:hypothetical protein